MAIKINHRLDSDILVIGGGMAGCFAAIRASQLGSKVLVVDKGYIGRSCQSRFIGSNIAVCMPDHDKEICMRELIVGGEFLNDQEWVRIHVHESYALADELDRWGEEFGKDILGRDERGELSIIKVHGDINTQQLIISGPKMMDAFRKKLSKEGIPFLERVMMTGLLTDGDRIRAAVGFNYRNGETYLFTAKAIILAAAGCSFKLRPLTWSLTGDAQAMAYEAGARLRSMEIVGRNNYSRINAMEGPTGGLVLSWGMRYVNGLGEEFLNNYLPKIGSRTTHARDIFRQEIAEGRGPIFKDFTVIPPEKLRRLVEYRPEHFKALESMGLDPFKQLVPVEVEESVAVSGPHGTNGGGGGVEIDTWCATNIPGLYAIGDTAYGAPQGTQPVGGVNLSFCLLSGDRAARHAVDYAAPAASARDGRAIEHRAKEHLAGLGLALTREDGLPPEELIWRIQDSFLPFKEAMSDSAHLEKAIAKLMRVKEEDLPRLHCSDSHGLMKAAEVGSMLLVSEAMLRSMLAREESRGNRGLARKDFPQTDNVHWLKWTAVEKNGEQMHVGATDIPTPYFQPIRAKYVPYVHGRDEVDKFVGAQ
ncbi:MAG: FAD-binding protein [Chloroflexi bacterium]|nr:FAD-binding protein [Chloroflexota bacterium]